MRTVRAGVIKLARSPFAIVGYCEAARRTLAAACVLADGRAPHGSGPGRGFVASQCNE